MFVLLALKRRIPMPTERPHPRQFLAILFVVQGLFVAHGLASSPAVAQGLAAVPVNVSNFARAESDLYFGRYVKNGALGKFVHDREMTPVDKQPVIRMNRDTLYSFAVFDLDAGPVTIVLPDAGKRFMSMQMISEDHYVTEVVYGPGRFTYDKQKVGTRYVMAGVRTLANPDSADDMKAARGAQDAIKVEIARVGEFEVPNWDQTMQDGLRKAINDLAPFAVGLVTPRFGSRSEVDPVLHLIGTAQGWGGNPRYAAVYEGAYPKNNDGKTVHLLTVKDVPVDGFWSISLYNAEGFFQKNDLDSYSINNLTAKPNPDGSFTIQFGDCQKTTPNCLPIMAGWNYTVRLYRPHKQIVDGTWRMPAAQPVQ